MTCKQCKHYAPLDGEPEAGWCEFVSNSPVPFWMDKYRLAVEKFGSDVVATDGEECGAFAPDKPR